jgi:nitroreductase
MDFEQVVKTRRSVRSYRSQPVPDDVLERVLSAARMAPSANNIQPWHFVVVKDAKLREEVARNCFDQTFIAEAPVVIVCCGRKYPDRYSWISDNLYLVDVAIATDHLTLAARNEGLGTCWIGALDQKSLRKILNVPSGHDIIMVTPLGYPSSETVFRTSSNRKSLSEIVSYEGFGNRK